MKLSQPASSIFLILLVVTVGFGAALRLQSRGPRTHVVTIENMKFTPAVVNVSPGDTIEFKNADLVPHNVTELNAKLFDSGMISPNTNWKYLARKTGKFGYHCIYHPDMTGTIVVGEPTAAASTGHDAETKEAGRKF